MTATDPACSRGAAFILTIALLASMPAPAQDTGRPDGMRFVPNVESQFLHLTERAEPLGMNIGDSPDPSSCRHYQAMVRVEGSNDTPFFLVTRSGNAPDACSAADSPNETGNGNLIVFRLDSRPRNGERLRSNRLKKGSFIDFTAPPPQDRATAFFTVVGGNPFDSNPALRPGLVPGNELNGLRNYRHPGGMQVVGKMLAVALESPSSPALDVTQIMFFDISDPENPVFRSQFAPIDEAGRVLAKAGVVAITPLPSGRYLMMTTGGKNEIWFYYRSTRNDLSSPLLSWDFVGSHRSPPAPFDLQDAHQTLQFLREGSIGGDLYLAGARGFFLEDDRDRLDLYLVTSETSEFMPGEPVDVVPKRRGDRISPFPNTGGARLANLAAASTFHVTPSGELLFYATQHDNEGGGGSINLGEWRHIHMARPDSPLLVPAIGVDGPFEVDEGGRTSLTGFRDEPVERAWIQLFTEPDFGGTDFHSQSVVVDFDDRTLDDFDNFRRLESMQVIQPSGLKNKARSVKWYAPTGCSIFAQDFLDGISQTLTLTGNNSVQSANLDDFAARIDAVAFSQDCSFFYNNPYVLAWDLDRNGTFETEGTLAPFLATNLDGPLELDIRAQARHSFGGGPTAEATAKVRVRNVRPNVNDFRVSGVTSGFPNNNLPTVLMGLPIKAEATFTDAGVRDRQTASIAWGDGSVEPHTAFATFTDAFGGATGALSHSHRYTTAGVRQIRVTVIDDDNGAGAVVKSVLVQSPAEWITVVVTRLDVLIAATSDEVARLHLEQARQALAGSPKRPNEGAIAMIASGNFQAALGLVNAAVTSLGAAGLSDAARLAANLEPVVASLGALTGV